jgi:hypothetical protein
VCRKERKGMAGSNRAAGRTAARSLSAVAVPVARWRLVR